MTEKTRIWTDVDLEAEGLRHGYLRVPHSTNDSGYGWIPVPITVVRNGEGPSVLLMAGNHGDEYEGQVLLMKFLRDLAPDRVQGRIIILPGVNAPAVAAGTRVSPIDGGNLNRLFPGRADGTPTEMIAHYVVDVLLPRVRYCFDFHSGGCSSEYIPLAHVVPPDDAAIRDEAIGFLHAFAMPNNVVVEGLMGGDQRLLGSCYRLGVGHMSTELGGAGSLSLDAYRAAERGLPRLLAHVGVLRANGADALPPQMRFYRRQPARDFLYADATGLFEPYVTLGDVVAAGDAAGAIHFTETPWLAPKPVVFAHAGTVLARRAPARTRIGDCLFVLGTPFDA